MRWSTRQGSIALPGYTHMQQAMPSSVKLWAGGFANELRDDAAGLRATLRRIDKSPLGSAAGYGAPALKLDRDATRQGDGLRQRAGARDLRAALARQGRERSCCSRSR